MAKKRKYTPGPARIANKLRAMLKAKIKELHLIDTGALYDSIFVEPDDNGGFIIYAEPYYIYLDEGTENIPAFNISEETINSKEFQDYISTVMIDEIEYEIRDI